MIDNELSQIDYLLKLSTETKDGVEARIHDAQTILYELFEKKIEVNAIISELEFRRDGIMGE